MEPESPETKKEQYSSRSLKTLLPYLKQHTGALLLGFIFMLIQNYSYLKVPQYMREIIDEIAGANRGQIVWSAVINILIFSAILAVSLFLMRKLIIGVSRKIEYQLREKLFHKLLSQEYLFFQANETGDLISRCTNDLNQVRTLLGPGVMYIPNSVSRLLLFLPVLIKMSGFLVFLISIVMAVLMASIIFLMPLLRPYFLLIQEAMGTMNNRVWQTISGISAIKQYIAEDIEVKRFLDLNEDYVKTQMKVIKLQGVLRPFFIFLFTLAELLILWIGGKMVIQGQMTIGQLLQFNIMISHLTFPILALGWMMSLMQQGISALGRINYILFHPLEDQTGKLKFASNEPQIEVKNLTYQYPGHNDVVLKDLQLSIPTGKIIGITGPVGCGKTTLLNILTGLLKPEPGQVFIDNKDIRDINLEDYHRHVAVVSQEPFLFSKSIYENISLGPDEITRDAVKQAAENAGLAKDVERFQDSYDQVIGERGITLSGGQKQRTAIARALGKCAPLLIMDDPLSSVDSRTEEFILENLSTHKCYKTLVLVSHRISVLRKADIIYVMDGGRIVEQGNHGGLMNRDGLYAKLAGMQQMQMELEEEK